MQVKLALLTFNYLLIHSEMEEKDKRYKSYPREYIKCVHTRVNCMKSNAYSTNHLLYLLTLYMQDAGNTYKHKVCV